MSVISLTSCRRKLAHGRPWSRHRNTSDRGADAKCKSAVGYDFDPITVDIPAKAANNGIDCITFPRRTYPVDSTWSSRVHRCHIFFDVLIAAFPTIHAALKPGGHLILSRILHAPPMSA